MELDDLKKSWSVLDKQLQKEAIVDKERIAKLIARYKKNATNELDKIKSFQRTSLIVAILLFLMMGAAVVVDTGFFAELKMTIKVITMTVFVVGSVILGLWWDIKTYRFSRNTHVAEMSTIQAMQRMDLFRRWSVMELRIALCWAVVFFALYYWFRDFYTQPLVSQLSFFAFTFASIIVLLIFIQKRIFKHLNEIKKNLDEIKELENEN